MEGQVFLDITPFPLLVVSLWMLLVATAAASRSSRTGYGRTAASRWAKCRGGGGGRRTEGPCVADRLCQEKRCLLHLGSAWYHPKRFWSVQGSHNSCSYSFVPDFSPTVLVAFRNKVVANGLLICCIVSPSGVCTGPTITWQSFPRSLQQCKPGHECHTSNWPWAFHFPILTLPSTGGQALCWMRMEEFRGGKDVQMDRGIQRREGMEMGSGARCRRGDLGGDGGCG